MVTAAGTVLARHRREPDHAGAVVRDEGHVTALENKVLAARGQEGRPCHRKARRPPSAEAMAEAAAVRGQPGPAGAGHRLRRVGSGRQAAEPGGEQGLTGAGRGIAVQEERKSPSEGGFTMSFTVPAASQDEPEISVPVSVIGDAAELLALVAELIDTSPAA